MSGLSTYHSQFTELFSLLRHRAPLAPWEGLGLVLLLWMFTDVYSL